MELDIRHAAGSTAMLTVRLLVPVASPRLDCWQCEYQLARDRTAGRPIYGIDSWQAFQLAIRTVEAELSHLWYLDAPADPKSPFGGRPTE